MQINYKIPPKEHVHGLYYGLNVELKFLCKTKSYFKPRSPEQYKQIYSREYPYVVNKTITSPLLRVMLKE